MQWIEILHWERTNIDIPHRMLSKLLSNRRYLAPSEAGKYDNSNKISARKSYRANYQPHNKIILKTWIAGRNNVSPSSSSLPARGMMAWPRLESTYYATKGNFIQRWKGGGGGGSWLSCRLGTMVDIQARILFCLQNVWIIITLECSRESFAATE